MMHFPKRPFPKEVLKISLPPLLTALLFLIALFLVFVPSIERSLMEQKKQMLNSEIQTVWAILEYYDGRAKAGELSLEKAQRMAKDQIRGIRYGDDGKDYFWINDRQPTMILHPYRPDLEGRDLSAFTDPEQRLLFVEFVKATEKNGSGYVEYTWQWKDNPKRIVPKISFVKVFPSWGWIVGTGVYIEDVRDDVSRLTLRLIFISAGIFAVILLLSFLVIRNHLEEMKQRVAWAQHSPNTTLTVDHERTRALNAR